jgi:hypothetical protein
MPTFSLNTPAPSLPADTQLTARFPAQIDGNPVTDIQSAYWIAAICMFQGEAGAQQMLQNLPGSGLEQMSIANASATVDDEEVQITAIRIPGQDANLIITNFDAFARAIGMEDAADRPTITPANIGGKNAYISTDADGDVSYGFASGDVFFTVSDVTQEQAAIIFAAIP